MSLPPASCLCGRWWLLRGVFTCDCCQRHKRKHPAAFVDSVLVSFMSSLRRRYIEFHKYLAVAYVVNELGCNVSVFTFDQLAVRASRGFCSWLCRMRACACGRIQMLLLLIIAFVALTFLSCGRCCCTQAQRIRDSNGEVRVPTLRCVQTISTYVWNVDRFMSLRMDWQRHCWRR